MTLKGVCDWKALGLELGLLYPTLQRIDVDHHGIIEICKIEMLAAWLQQQDDVCHMGIPSWSVLQRALRCIGENELATQITSGYCELTGVTVYMYICK